VTVTLVSTAAALHAAPDFTVHRRDTAEAALRFSGAGTRTVDLRTVHGSIHVSADSGSDVRLSMVRTVDAESDAAADEAVRDVRIDTTDNAATIGAIVRQPHGVACGEPADESSYSWWDRPRYTVRVDLTARVPADSRIRLCAIQGAEIEMAGVTGDFDVTNVNGAISLSGLRGAGRATTVNGAVTAAFAAPPRDTSIFQTVNGNVTVTFPPSLSADLRLKTFHGELLTDFEVQPLQAAARHQPESRNGRYVYSSNRYTVVRAGGGGPELTLETLNGDVRVLRASR
jgi:DUF4097 and DUF4098 domain-containing protein YvlB